MYLKLETPTINLSLSYSGDNKTLDTTMYLNIFS